MHLKYSCPRRTRAPSQSKDVSGFGQGQSSLTSDWVSNMTNGQMYLRNSCIVNCKKRLISRRLLTRGGLSAYNVHEVSTNQKSTLKMHAAKALKLKNLDCIARNQFQSNLLLLVKNPPQHKVQRSLRSIKKWSVKSQQHVVFHTMSRPVIHDFERNKIPVCH